MENGDRGIDVWIVGISALLIAVLSLLPIGLLRLGDEETVFTLRDIFGLGYIVPIVSVGLGVIAVVQLRRAATSPIAAWGFGLMAGFTALAIVLVEAMGRVIPRSVLPATLRRFVFNLGVTATPWIAVVLAVAALVAARGRTDEFLASLSRDSSETRTRHVFRLGGVACALGGVIAMALSRNDSLAVVRYAGGEVSVETWAIPWIGPGSLIVVLVMLVCIVGIASGYAAGVCSACGSAISWVTAATTGVMVATSGLLVDTGALEWVARQVESADLPDELKFAQTASVVSTSGPVGGYVGACLAALGFSASMANRSRRA